jgi:hypothetical protein
MYLIAVHMYVHMYVHIHRNIAMDLMAIITSLSNEDNLISNLLPQSVLEQNAFEKVS